MVCRDKIVLRKLLEDTNVAEDMLGDCGLAFLEKRESH